MSQVIDYKLPLYLHSVKAGFPSPAEDFVEKRLDINEYLIKHPESSFFVRVSGDSMVNAGIFSGDILVVDRSLQAKNNDIVIAVLDGDLTVKRIKFKDGKTWLYPENENYKPIEVKKEMTFLVWGVVSSVIRKIY